MHEVSIVSSIVRTLEMELDQEQLDTMEAIYLKVGVLSNIEPQLLHNAFEAYRHQSSPFGKVKLHIESTPLKIKCELCNHETEVKNYRFYCENCDRPSKNVIQGEELLIHKVEFADEAL